MGYRFPERRSHFPRIGKMRATVVVDNENAGGRIVLAAYSVASMVSQVAKWLLMRMPVLSGLIAQRDRLLVQQQLLLEKLNQQNQPNFTSVASASALWPGRSYFTDLRLDSAAPNLLQP
jgi:hypothetical protein